MVENLFWNYLDQYLEYTNVSWLSFILQTFTNDEDHKAHLLFLLLMMTWPSFLIWGEITPLPAISPHQVKGQA